MAGDLYLWYPWWAPTFELAFPTGRDNATFRDKGTEVPLLTTGQAQNLAKGRDGPGRAGTAKIRDGTRDKTGQNRKGRSKTGKWCSKTENVVLKQEKDVLNQENDVRKQEIWSFFWKFWIHFVLGRPGTEEFVPGFLLLPLSRDKGTAGQAKLFCPGTKGQHFVPWKC